MGPVLSELPGPGHPCPAHLSPPVASASLAPEAALLACATAPETSGLARGGPERGPQTSTSSRPPGDGGTYSGCAPPPPAAGGRSGLARWDTARRMAAKLIPTALCQGPRGWLRGDTTLAWEGQWAGRALVSLPLPTMGGQGAPAGPGPVLGWQPAAAGSYVRTLLGEETLGQRPVWVPQSLDIRDRGPQYSDPTPMTASEPWPGGPSWGPSCCGVQLQGRACLRAGRLADSYSRGAQPASPRGRLQPLGLPCLCPSQEGGDPGSELSSCPGASGAPRPGLGLKTKPRDTVRSESGHTRPRVSVLPAEHGLTIRAPKGPCSSLARGCCFNPPKGGGSETPLLPRASSRPGSGARPVPLQGGVLPAKGEDEVGV